MSKKKIALLHTGKTAGGTISNTFNSAGMNYTEIHIFTGLDPWNRTVTIETVAELAGAEYDIYIVPTREPAARVISAFNGLHADGGDAWLNPASPFVPTDNTTLERVVADPLSFRSGGVGTAFLQALSTCFDQLPGGVSAFAAALAGAPGGCNDVARRAIADPLIGTSHIAQGYSFLMSELVVRPSEGRRGVAAGSALNQMRIYGKRIFHVSQENFDADFAAMWQWLCIEQSPTFVKHTGAMPAHVQARHDDVALTTEGRAALEAYLIKDRYTLRAGYPHREYAFPSQQQHRVSESVNACNIHPNRYIDCMRQPATDCDDACKNPLHRLKIKLNKCPKFLISTPPLPLLLTRLSVSISVVASRF